MSESVNAIVTRERGIGHLSGHYFHGKLIRNMPQNQFDDWRAIGWVDYATAEQVAEAEEEDARIAAALAEAERPNAPTPVEAKSPAQLPAIAPADVKPFDAKAEKPA